MNNEYLTVMAVSGLIGLIWAIQKSRSPALDARAKILNYGKTHGLVGIFFVFIGLLVWLFPIVMYIKTNNSKSIWAVALGFIFFGLIFFILPGIYFLRKARAGIKSANDVRRYLNFIINEGIRDIEIISTKTKSSNVSGTLSSIENLIDLGFLPFFSIDKKSGRLIDNRPSTSTSENLRKVVFKCTFCGGNNSKHLNNDSNLGQSINCDWCGNPSDLK